RVERDRVERPVLRNLVDDREAVTRVAPRQVPADQARAVLDVDADPAVAVRHVPERAAVRPRPEDAGARVVGGDILGNRGAAELEPDADVVSDGAIPFDLSRTAERVAAEDAGAGEIGER